MDMRVRVGDSGLYTYPGVVAVCGEPQFLDEEFDTLLNPQLIIEVLSPFTEKKDRVWKFGRYQTLESLIEYVLVDSTQILVERFRRPHRGSNGDWSYRSFERLEDVVELKSIDCRLVLSDVYAKGRLRKGQIRGRHLKQWRKVQSLPAQLGKSRVTQDSTG